MRCLGLRPLNCRLWQAAWLAVVLMPLAILSLCAAADQSVGNGQQQVLAASLDRLHDAPGIDGDCHGENPRLSRALRQFAGFGCSSTGGGVGVALKAAWPLGKSHVLRRGGERWLVIALGRDRAMPLGSMPSAKRIISPGSLSAEYALLRRLEL